MTGIQERVESSAAGRFVISVVLILTLVTLVVWSAPDSRLRQRLFPTARAYLTVTGLEQSWETYSPDPRRQVLEFQARVEYADGTRQIWRVPRGGRVVGTYREYRWRKWVEHVRDDTMKDLWRPAAVYAARRGQRDGRMPVRVTLVRRWYDIPPPGAVDRHPPWHEFAYYTLDITPAILSGRRG